MKRRTTIKPDDSIERREVSKNDVEDALKSVLTVPRGQSRSENREPSKAELERRYRLDRRKPYQTGRD